MDGVVTHYSANNYSTNNIFDSLLQESERSGSEATTTKRRNAIPPNYIFLIDRKNALVRGELH